MKLSHVPALDGLRGIAIVLVLLNHTEPALPGGGLGVDLFFCLSGFLITALLVNEWSARGTVSLSSFYRRRALRLLPALLLVCAVTLALAPAAYPQALVAVTYVANFARLEGYGLGSFEHFWSLAQEEQFYLVWPIALIALLRFAPRLLVPVLSLLFVAVSLHGLTAANISRLWYGPDMHAGGLVIGSLAAVLYVRSSRVRAPVVPAALVSIVCIATLSQSNARFVLPVFALSATAIVLALARGDSSWLARPLSVRPLRYMGTISYGVYLWHWPAFVALGWKLGLPVTLVCAVLSYRYVEQPFLRRKRQSRGVGAVASSQPRLSSSNAWWKSKWTRSVGKTVVVPSD